MPRTSRRVYAAVIVVVLLAVNIVAIRWSAEFFRAPQSGGLLKYGAELPKLKGQSLMGQKTVELAPNRNNLILYFSTTTAPSFSIELIKYGEILSEQYGEKGLKVTTILPGDVPELRTLIEHSLLNYDLIVDENRQLGEKLGLANGENGVFLFNDRGRCRFSTRSRMSAGDLRQLIAVEFLSVDPFGQTAVAEQAIQQGKQLGSWSVVNVRSWERTSLEKIRSGAPRLFVFFTAECSVCSLPGYLEQFGKFEQERQREGSVDKMPVLVFDFNFSANDVLEQLNVHHINSPAYIANEQLPAVEEIVQGETLNRETVVAVETDLQGRVLNISALKSLIAGLRHEGVAATKPQVSQAATGATYEEVFNHIPLGAYDVAAYQGKYILTDVKGNRIFVIRDDMQVEREFGKIGSGPDRLFHPGSLDVAGDGTIYVQDGGNERIVKFTAAGHYLGELPLANYEGLAVGPGNELYLGQPEAGHLITVYSSLGKKLRSFGQLKKFSEIYGPAFAEKDLPYKLAFNRVRLSTDRDGNLYVSFMLTPLLQKYSPAGDLLFESRLEAPEIDQLTAAIQKTKYITWGGDGVDARIIALDPVIDPTTGNILVPLVDGSIYLAGRDGKKLMLLRPQSRQRTNETFYPFVAGLGAKGELLVAPFPPKRWYRLVIPADIMSNAAATLDEKKPTLVAR